VGFFKISRRRTSIGSIVQSYGGLRAVVVPPGGLRRLLECEHVNFGTFYIDHRSSIFFGVNVADCDAQGRGDRA